MPQSQVALLFIGIGAALIVVGGLVWLGAFGWFGSLPGDLKVERDQLTLYLPITSMIVLSVVLSSLLYIVRRVF